MRYIFLLLLPLSMVDSGFASTLSILGTNRSVELDPSVQHIPLNPSQLHLRPPSPRVPDDPKLFVGLSVFRDGFRCAQTILTGFQRAKKPRSISFGVVDQVNPSDQHCLDEFCIMAQKVWPDQGECPFKDQIRVDERSSSESRGPTLARHYQQKLIQDEDFCLQLDGHSIFTNGWDQNLLKEWKDIGNEMAVMTTYIHHIHNFVAENGDNKLPKEVDLPHLCTTMRGANGLVRNVGASVIGESKMPQLQALWGAGFSYNKCHAEKRVPVDSHMLWIFDGEEFIRASRLWTHGYDMYSPSKLGSVVYHNYTSVPARFESIPVDQKRKDQEEKMGINRFKVLVGQPFVGRVTTIELDKYGFGNVRTLKQYLEFCGVTFEEGKKDAESCEQRHWVPYANATEVEEIVGGVWTLHGTPNRIIVQENDVKNVGQLWHRATDSINVDTFHYAAPIILFFGGALVIVAFVNNSLSRRFRRNRRTKPVSNICYPV